MQNPPITARVFDFKWTEYNVTQTVLYWRESLIFASNSSVEQKNVQINLSIYPNSTDQISQAQTQLIAVAKNVDSYWEPIKNWTPIALLLSQDADKLAVLTTIGIVAAISIFYIAKFRNRTLKISYSKLPEKDKKILTALYVTEKRRTAVTAGNIAATLIKIDQQIGNAELAARLQVLAGLGLVSHRIQNLHDEPLLVWKLKLKI